VEWECGQRKHVLVRLVLDAETLSWIPGCVPKLDLDLDPGTLPGAVYVLSLVVFAVSFVQWAVRDKTDRVLPSRLRRDRVRGGERMKREIDGSDEGTTRPRGCREDERDARRQPTRPKKGNRNSVVIERQLVLQTWPRSTK